jgi:hypothetical protein
MGQETASRLNLWIAVALTLGVLGTVTVSCLATADDGEDTRRADPAGGQRPPDGRALPDRADPAQPSQRLTVVLPAATGGYVRVQQKDEQGQLDRLRRAGLRNAVTGRYAAAGSPEPVFTVYGAELEPALPDTDITQAATRELDEAFGRLAIAGFISYDGTSRAVDPGPRGGHVRCTTLQQKDRRPVACGWVDRFTLGYLLDARRNRTEADVAALLTALRADAEVSRNP